MLWTKPEEYYTSFSQIHFSERDPTLDVILTQQPAGAKHILFRITRDDAYAWIGRFKRRAVDEIGID